MSETKLKRGLSPRHVLFIGLGSAVGTGLFYGSAGAIQLAGPAIMLTYLILCLVHLVHMQLNI